LIVFQTFIPGIIEQHCEVDQLGGEVVDERSVLLSPDGRDLEMCEGLIWVEQFSRERVKDL
jgi:hypothetical protein